MKLLNENKIILDLCGGTGAWSKPYKENGYDVRLISLPNHNVLTYEPPHNVYGILAAPPCTDFSLACSRLWKEKDDDGRTEKSLKIVKACLDIITKSKPKFWALENPRGRLHKYIGQPLYTFYQYEFGGLFYKPTWIWGNFNPMIIKGPMNKEPIRLADATSKIMYQLPEGYDLNIDHNKRAAQRSIIPPGFAKAFYQANK